MSLTTQVISNNILGVAGRIEDAAMKSLNDAAENILRESAEEVPKDTGDLMRSGTVEPHGEQVWIRYPLEYAAKQHEVPAMDYTTPGTKWKYLEDPLRRNRDNVIKEVADGVSVVLRG